MIKDKIADFYRYRHVFLDMAVKQLKVRYAGSVLGISLAVFNPILLTMGVVFAFTAIFNVRMRDFPLFVLAGMFPWMFFVSALSEATRIFLSQQNILRQFRLPRETLPASCVLSHFLNYLIGWLFFLPLFLYFNPRVLPLFFLFVFVSLLFLVFTTGLGLLFSVVHVFCRDVGHLLDIVFMFWMWVTPVFYSADMIPEGLRWICVMNPMAGFITFYRDVLFFGRVPDLFVFVQVVLWSLGSLCCGAGIFWRFEPQLLKRI